MKIGIVTLTEGCNIGQRLQNYALQTAIESMGYEVATIRQDYPYSKIKRFIRDCQASILHPCKYLQMLLRGARFSRFNRQWINFENKKLIFDAANEEIEKKYDGFVVGSDQVWNPNSPFVGTNQFLQFTQQAKRMTYAPSFSAERIPEEKEKLFRIGLSGFRSITVREEKGRELVHQLTGKNATVVLDPTLLLSKKEWEKVIRVYEKKPRNKYILQFFLGDSSKYEVSKIDNLEMYEMVAITDTTPIAPDEFLDLIRGAELVLTDSYHGSIFSIIFERPFVNFQRLGIGSSMGSRFSSLYQLIGQNRSYNFLIENCTQVYKLAYDEVKYRIELERDKSKRILRTNLESII